MDTFLLLLPDFALILLGVGLRRQAAFSDGFWMGLEKLVYFVLFPALLFNALAKVEIDLATTLPLFLAGLTVMVSGFVLGLLPRKWMGLDDMSFASRVQCAYRFNTYIGMAVIMNALGETGVRYFGILIGFVIPIINVLALSTLIWHSGQKGRPIDHTLRLIKALICNPLIIGCVAGLFFSRTRLVFPLFINTTFALMTSVTMPLALISIGGSLSMKGLEKNYQPALTALILKIIILPVIGYVLLKAFSVSGTPFKTGMIFFTLPTSTAIYVLSAQLNADTQLASAAIMLSTLVSFASLSLVLLL